jgi:hypothetical protein
MHAASFEKVVRSPNIRLESRERISVRNANDRLRRQMKYELRFMQADRTLERPQIFELAIEHRAAIDITAAEKFRLRVGVPYQHCDVRAALQQLANQPRPDDPRRAGHEYATLSPEVALAHGASPRV